MVHFLVESRRSASPGLTVVVESSTHSAALRAAILKAKGINAMWVADAHRASACIQAGVNAILFLAARTAFTGEFLSNLPRQAGILQLVISGANHFSRRNPLQFRRPYENAVPLRQLLKPKVVLCHTDCNISGSGLKDVCDAFGIPSSSVSRLYGLPASNVAVGTVAMERNHDKFPTILDLLVCSLRF